LRYIAVVVSQTDNHVVAARASCFSVSGKPQAIARLVELEKQVRSTGQTIGSYHVGAALPDTAARESQILLESIDQAKRAQSGLDAIR
jgi:hypothetical protein